MERPAPQAASWRSVSWDNWQFTRAHARQTDVGAPAPELILAPAELIEVLQRLLSTPVNRLLILAGNPQTRSAACLEHEVGEKQVKARPGNEEVSTTFHPRPDVQTTYVAPDSEIEKLIAVIWQELLGIERIGVNDHFFELGGHSLMAAKLIARLREALLLEIPLQSIFESPTIAELAVTAEQLFVEKLEQLSDEEAERLMADVFHQGY